MYSRLISTNHIILKILNLSSPNPFPLNLLRLKSKRKNQFQVYRLGFMCHHFNPSLALQMQLLLFRFSGISCLIYKDIVKVYASIDLLDNVFFYSSKLICPLCSSQFFYSMFHPGCMQNLLSRSLHYCNGSFMQSTSLLVLCNIWFRFLALHKSTCTQHLTRESCSPL